MTDKHTPRTCDDCGVTWDRKHNLKDIVLCPLHAAAPELLEALEALVKAHPGGDERDMCVGTECLCHKARATIKAARGDA